jgi:hypothetical protein
MKNIDRLNVSVRLLPASSILFVFSLFFISSSSLRGQTFIGLSAGADLYDQVDFRAAAVMEWSKNDLYSWQTELIYVKRENVSLLQLLPQNSNYVRPIISYVEVPFLFKIKLNLQGARLYALLGPKIGYALAAYSTIWKENGQLLKQEIRLEDIEVAGWDIGMNLGAGLEKEISQGKKIFVEFRYYLGMKDLFPQGETEIYNEGKSFNLGFLIPIKK